MQKVINMSDFVSHDLLPDLWDEIIKRLWTYLEREESVQKIEERNKLESCLKDFLCIVPQDRRFFLPETAEVLKRTVLELKSFSANKAITGFEALFQYASNLFTKPWRKEYHVLKMYSGFYQHEVQSNLVDAIKIFEAMGYRQLSENLLILDGPICPDQVISVARDAMAAYIECQIMKQIYLGLEALNLDCTWQEVFKFREKNIGGTTQAIKNLANAIQERKLRKDKMSTLDNFYSSVQQQPNAHYQNCAQTYTQTQKYAATPYYGTQNGHCAMHPPTMAPTHCSVHANINSNSYIYNNNVNKLIASYPAPSNPYVHQHHHYAHAGNQPHMSHSRSLEQYSEPQPLLPHRHSFDHQHQGCMSAHHYQQPSYPQMHVYESPYDCVDSTGSNASYAIVASSPYNVSGNRFPLPYSISSQLNAECAAPATVTCNGVKGIEPYGNPDNLYATVSKANTCSLHHTAPAARCVPTTTKDFNTYRQRSFPPDQHLIDFDDRAPLTAHDYHAQYQGLTQNNSFDGSYEHSTRQAKRAVNRLTANYAHTNTPIISPVAIESDQYGYARPLPRSSRNRSNASMTEKYLKQVQHALENESEDMTRNSAHLLHPYEDFVHVGMSEKVRVSPTQAIKNQDGVGSFETWNTVYQNLERTGYASDVSDRDRDRERDRERVELLQNLDLKALQLGNSTGSTTDTDVERRRVTELKAGRQNLDKVRNLEKSSKAAEERSAQSVLPATNGLNGKKGTLSANNVIAQNNNNEIIVAGKDVRRVPELSKRSPRNVQTSSKTLSSSVRQVNDSKEWSCRFCTFLNPEAERVCEMCSKSKNFNLESAPSHAPTCV